jgi:heat shock protein HslJ
VAGGREYRGCGGDPAALLQGAAWMVEDVNGTGVVAQPRMTLAFGPDGRVAGRAACNSYTGQYALTGEGITISKTATTRMACAPALMTEEGLFLDVLGNVVRFAIGQDGALILHTRDRRTITARR